MENTNFIPTGVAGSIALQGNSPETINNILYKSINSSRTEWLNKIVPSEFIFTFVYEYKYDYLKSNNFMKGKNEFFRNKIIRVKFSSNWYLTQKHLTTEYFTIWLGTKLLKHGFYAIGTNPEESTQE